MPLRVVYLVLAFAGTDAFCFFSAEGFGVTPFLAAVFANDAASGFAGDLIVASLAYWAAMIVAERHADGPAPWGFVVVNHCVGLSAATPLYLSERERRRLPA